MNTPAAERVAAKSYCFGGLPVRCQYKRAGLTQCSGPVTGRTQRGCSACGWALCVHCITSHKCKGERG
jgi:hypothetical protein